MVVLQLYHDIGADDVYFLYEKLLDDKQLKERNLMPTCLAPNSQNPTFGEGLWHNQIRQDVPYYNMRWHVFKDFAPMICETVRNDAFVFLRNMGGEASAYSKAMQDTVFLITDARMLTRVRRHRGT